MILDLMIFKMTFSFYALQVNYSLSVELNLITVQGVFFVASIHPFRTRMSGSFESVRWKACLHRLDLGLYSYLKEFWGNGARTHVNSQGKIPSTGKILPRGASNPQPCVQQDSKLNTVPTSYSGLSGKY